MNTNTVVLRWLGVKDYLTCWQHMQDFTNNRSEDSIDEIWFLEHPAIFTLGQNGKQEHILCAGDIPVVKTDRGGQVTYHGPGQLMIYTLIDLKRKKFTVRQIVTLLEQSIIDFLAEYNIPAKGDRCAPGVYVNEQKICSIGLRVRHFCVYHGLAFNIAMDLEPFKRINPCGFENLKMAQLADWQPEVSVQSVAQNLINHLKNNLVYTQHTWILEESFNIKEYSNGSNQTARC